MNGLSRTAFKRIAERDDWRCHYCHKDLQDAAEGDCCVDHRTPQSRGGPNAQWNLALCCRRCNNTKGTLSYLEYVWEIRGRLSYFIPEERSPELRPRRSAA